MSWCVGATSLGRVCVGRLCWVWCWCWRQAPVVGVVVLRCRWSVLVVAWSAVSAAWLESCSDKSSLE
eukprot:7091005-Pyramimonas_sp.AAC.1